MSSLVEHARRELTLIGEDQDVIDGLVKVVQAYADMGHSGGSHMVCYPRLCALLNFEPLTPITDNPDEWEDRTEQSGFPLWQNVRDSKAMSKDGGKTYQLVLDAGGLSSIVYTTAQAVH